MTRIKTIDYKESTGKLRTIYDELIKSRGKLANVHKIQSLRPESIRQHMDLYMGIMFSRSELSRAQREMMAVVVSVANGCSYCTRHHAEALNHYWKDDEKIDQLIGGSWETILDQHEAALCNYAKSLTTTPSKHEDHDLTIYLKQAGFSDNAILDASLVISYFNFVNRMVLSLEVEVEDGGEGGYKY